MVAPRLEDWDRREQIQNRQSSVSIQIFPHRSALAMVAEHGTTAVAESNASRSELILQQRNSQTYRARITRSRYHQSPSRRSVLLANSDSLPLSSLSAPRAEKRSSVLRQSLHHLLSSGVTGDVRRCGRCVRVDTVQRDCPLVRRVGRRVKRGCHGSSGQWGLGVVCRFCRDDRERFRLGSVWLQRYSARRTLE